MKDFFQNNIQHLKISKYYIKKNLKNIFSNNNNNLLSDESILSGIDPLLMME
jgi:hypothetical protein